MSKGSNYRPCDKDRFDKEFDRIFGKPEEEKPSEAEEWARLGEHMVTETDDHKG